MSGLLFGLPQLCQTCQIPIEFTEMDNPTLISYRDSVYKGDRYHCSDGCKNIFDDEPENMRTPGCPFSKSSKAIVVVLM